MTRAGVGGGPGNGNIGDALVYESPGSSRSAKIFERVSHMAYRVSSDRTSVFRAIRDQRFAICEARQFGCGQRAALKYSERPTPLIETSRKLHNDALRRGQRGKGIRGKGKKSDGRHFFPLPLGPFIPTQLASAASEESALKMGAGDSGLGAREPSLHPLGQSVSFMMTVNKSASTRGTGPLTC